VRLTKNATTLIQGVLCSILGRVLVFVMVNVTMYSMLERCNHPDFEDIIYIKYLGGDFRVARSECAISRSYLSDRKLRIATTALRR
jgi:hypothetical protein